ncbi:hypothetical protein Y032_0374g198 [Ancylostoma ceylanicum]|uniref:Uncharacterized protein n=1 Tax=Ancylostoma ceylanicum TaxID=53326 RepID=A0A016RTT7_9BILA|nr:hypothetical protein Y032_0374g198 [Ancylostoma ceylanicum]
MQSSNDVRQFRASSPLRQRLRSGRRYVGNLHWDSSASDLSDGTAESLTRYIEELENPLRSDSFSSISTVTAREEFETAIDNIKRGIFLFGNSRGKGVPITELSTVMDSPPDLSPNAPPTGFEEPSNYFANLQATPAPPSASSTGQASTEGSVDSSGFEKVDHDVLEEYGQQFVNQMQQSLFGKLPETDLSVSCTFPH